MAINKERSQISKALALLKSGRIRKALTTGLYGRIAVSRELLERSQTPSKQKHTIKK